MLYPSTAPMMARAALAAALVVYLSLPRAYAELLGSPLDHGGPGAHLLAMGLVSIGLVALRDVVAASSRVVCSVVFTGVTQLVFALGAVEVGVTETMGVGYGPRFLMHASFEAARVGAADYPLPVGGWLVALALATWPVYLASSHLPETRFGRKRAAALAAVALLACGAVSWWMALRAQPGSSVGSFAAAVYRYHDDTPYEGGHFEDSELEVLETLGIRLTEGLRTPRAGTPPEEPPNLIIVFLESFQDNFTAAGGSPFPGLTPNLDRITARMTRVENAYNSATPTMLALSSLLCGVVPPIRAGKRPDGRAFTELHCLPDMLREAGFYQVFMGAARKRFTHKGEFFTRHGFDEVYGDEDWHSHREYRKSRITWGIDDIALVTEAVEKLEALRDGPPFHLALLTVNTHKPGFRTSDCPAYRNPAGNSRYLNGIHCTDRALGRLFDGIDRLGLFESSVIVLVGDHTVFPVPEIVDQLGADVARGYYGNVYMALHSPIRELPPTIDWFTHSPDLAPTVLDLLGIPLEVPFQMGKSILGERRHLQHMLGPETEILDGSFRAAWRSARHCPPAIVASVRLPRPGSLFKPCQRVRLVSKLNYWLDLGRRQPKDARAEQPTGETPPR